MEPPLGSGYQRIGDLADWAGLAVDELRALGQVWSEQRDKLEGLDDMRQFRTRLVRSWAIETGVIERVYAIDRGTTQLLLEKGLEESLLVGGTDRDPAEVAAILRDHQHTLEGLFDFVAQRRPLTTSYVKELHAALTQNQPTTQALDPLGRVRDVPLLRGAFKLQPNNPRRVDGTMHAYCPPELVDEEMERLLTWHAAHEVAGVPPEVEAAWLHHRFTQIHPFQDGNGRVARSLASLVYLRAGWFPLSIDRDRRTAYIDALEAADAGALTALIDQFAALARDALVRALAISDQAQQDLKGIQSVVAAARDRMIGSSPDTAVADVDLAKEMAAGLLRLGDDQLRQVKAVIDREIADVRPNFSCSVVAAQHGDPQTKWYVGTQFSLARTHHYFANVRAYNGWVRLRMSDFDEGVEHEVIAWLNGMGSTFRGLIAGTAAYIRWDFQDGVRTQTETVVVSTELFQLNHRESPGAAERRFADWLQHATTVGLGHWERGLGQG